MKDDNITEPVKLITSRLLPHLTNGELRQLKHKIWIEELSRNLYGRGGKLDLSDNPPCPINTDHSVIKYGKAGKKQRYYCKECKTAFVGGSKSMLANSQLDLTTWHLFINGLLFWSATLEQLAAICRISETTAFYCRLRVFYALEILNNKITLSRNIEADETYVVHNLKGQDPEDLSRPTRRRGGLNTLKNRNSNSICIVVAVEKDVGMENHYRIASRVVGFGVPTVHRIYNVLSPKITPCENTTLITDGTRAYGLLAKNLGLNWKRLPAQTKGSKKVPQIDGRYSIQTVNSFHSQLKDFLRQMHGVSSKYLQGFLELFDFNINYSDLSIDEQEILILKTLLDCKFHLTNEELANRYCIPTYIGQVAAEWKRYLSKTEIKIYKAAKQRIAKKEIVKKYNVSYKYINRLVERIEKLNIDDEIFLKNHKKTPKPKIGYTEAQWEIYTLYKTGKYTYKDLAKKCGCTSQNIGKIIRKIDKTPSAYERAERKSRAKRSQHSTYAEEKKKMVADKHKKIYDQFNVLCSGNSNISLTQAYITIAKWNNLSKNTVRNIVFKFRKTDPNAVWRKKGTRIAIDVNHKLNLPEASEEQ